MYAKDIAIVTSGALAKNGGIITISEVFAHKANIPLYDLATNPAVPVLLNDFQTILFSGFDESFVELTRYLKSIGKKIAVWWHFSCACEVDNDIGKAWRALLPLLKDHSIDLFISSKKDVDRIIHNFFGIPTFFVMNNITDTSRRNLPKEGLGIYSGSSNYWIKNLYSNLYACLMTKLHVDIIPYDSSLQGIVQNLGMEQYVTGLSERIDYEDFQSRLASRELVSYVTFSECAPLIPLEALNNGVICITGNNHSYFCEDERLRSMLVVSKPDDPMSIYRSINYALMHKFEIMERYAEWKSSYDRTQQYNFIRLFELISSL